LCNSLLRTGHLFTPLYIGLEPPNTFLLFGIVEEEEEEDEEDEDEDEDEDVEGLGLELEVGLVAEGDYTWP
jgi:hypothetical protein